MSADTGVGPAIASGSHTYRGIWALLPQAPRNRTQARVGDDGLCTVRPVNNPDRITSSPETSIRPTRLAQLEGKSPVPNSPNKHEGAEQEPEVADAVGNEGLLARAEPCLDR